MPRQKVLARTFDPRTVTVSGTTYAAANLEQFDIKPVDSRQVGGFGGMQYTYLLETNDAYWSFLDKLAVAACDVADEEGDDCYKVLAIYKDMGKIK